MSRTIWSRNSRAVWNMSSLFSSERKRFCTRSICWKTAPMITLRMRITTISSISEKPACAAALLFRIELVIIMSLPLESFFQRSLAKKGLRAVNGAQRNGRGILGDGAGGILQARGDDDHARQGGQLLDVPADVIRGIAAGMVEHAVVRRNRGLRLGEVDHTVTELRTDAAIRSGGRRGVPVYLNGPSGGGRMRGSDAVLDRDCLHAAVGGHHVDLLD